MGTYEYTYSISGVGTLTGSRDWYRRDSNESITTYYGTYSPLHIIERSDFRLEGSKGYIRVTDEVSISDRNHNLRKSESQWSLHLSGYQQASWTATYEYGNYVVLQNTETVYQESYTQRYYEDQILQETTQCLDTTSFETIENITIERGRFECAVFKVVMRENGAYAGYGKAWIDVEDGVLIRQRQYDSNDALVVEIVVTSLPSEQSWGTVIVLAVVAVGGLAVVYSLFKRRDASSAPHNEGIYLE